MFQDLQNIYKNHKSFLVMGVLFLVLIIFSLGLSLGYFGFQSPAKNTEPANRETEKEENIHLAFLFEIYDKIQENYWDKISDEQLVNIFEKGTEKLLGAELTLAQNTKAGLKAMLSKIIEVLDEQKKKQFSADLSSIVLINLKPFGRSQLYTTKKEKGLKKMLQNITQEANLYEALGLDKDASEDEVAQRYQEKKDRLEGQEKLPEAEKQLQELDYAYEVLSDEAKKEKYDQAGIEPTVRAKLIRPSIAYMQITRFSPTTLEEFQKEANKIDKGDELDSLILDLRGNIGGSIDILPWFLGPFIGKNQYAYEFFSQGDYTPFKTQTGWLNSLVRYKKMVILIDNQTQSSAELMAATLKKYNVGVVVGTSSKGWGTIERVFKLENQIDPENETYSMFLVHSITLRDDGQPVEGRGIDPAININDPSWQQQLFAYFHYQDLIDAVGEILNINQE